MGQSPSLGGTDGVGTMDFGVPSRRTGRVAGGGNNSSMNRGQPQTSQPAFGKQGSNFGGDFGEEYSRQDRT
jgi:hypothetical protein